MIYLVGENNVSITIMWKSKKLGRVAKSALAADILTQINAAEARVWLIK